MAIRFEKHKYSRENRKVYSRQNKVSQLDKRRSVRLQWPVFTFSLAASLVHIACRVIEHSQHRHDAIGCSISATDVTVGGTDVVDGEPNATCTLADDGTLLEGVIDALDAVLLHAHQEAAAQLHMETGRKGL